MSGDKTTQGMPDPGPLMAMSTAYWQSQVLFTANRIGLFPLLSEGALETGEVARRLGLALRPTDLLLAACAALGLARKTSEGWGNGPVADAFLVPGRPAYLGEAIRYSENLYETWGALEQALRQGRPPLAAEEYLGRDPERTRHFVYGMHNRALGVGRALVGMVDLSGRTRMLDVGGGPGTYSALFALRYPELRSLVLDLPDVVAIAREIVASLGAEGRVETLPGSYYDTPFPAQRDAVLISGVLHRETEQTCRGLIGRARDTLVPGGLLMIPDVFTDETGAGPLFATLFGLNMMLTAPDGGVHRAVDVARWMQDAGFRDVEVRPFPPPMPHTLVLGRRAG